MYLESLSKLWYGNPEKMKKHYFKQSNDVLERAKGNNRISKNLIFALSTVSLGSVIIGTWVNTEIGQYSTAFLDAGLIMMSGFASDRAIKNIENKTSAINAVLDARRQWTMKSMVQTIISEKISMQR